MSSKNLVVTLLMSLALFNLTACKKDGDNGRTTIRKGNKAGTNTAQANKNGVNPNATIPGSTPNATTNTPGAAENTDVVSIGDASVYGGCPSVQAQAKTLGWKMDSVEVNESSSSTKKLKINYYILDKSTLANPVVYFNRNAYQRIDEDDLKRFAGYATQYKMDPILIDMRDAGCSKQTANAKSSTIYGSIANVLDAEVIRKKVLTGEVKKWKIMATRAGGVLALRYVQLAPEAVTSIHIADFAPVKDQVALEKAKMVQENDNWIQLQKSQNLSDSDLDQALKKLDAEKCTPDFKSCRELIDLYAGLQISDKTQWPNIAKDIKAIIAGTKKAADLKKVFDNRKNYIDKINAVKFLDIDSDKTLSACTTALKDEKAGTLSSCRLHVVLTKSEKANFRANLTHSSLDMEKIKDNLKKNNISYFLFAGGQSALYPSDIYQEHITEMGDVLDSGYNLIKDAGSEVSTHSLFLESLQSK